MKERESKVPKGIQTHEKASCAHCGSPIDDPQKIYCCSGCEIVATRLREFSLERYYELRNSKRGLPVSLGNETQKDRLWLVPIVERLKNSSSPTLIEMDVQGIHCAGCVWLIGEVFRRMHRGRIVINPVLGRCEITASRDFDVEKFVDEVERFGYRLGPPEKQLDSKRDSLILRAGIAVALAMNSMLFAVPQYFGLTEEPLRSIASSLEMGMALGAALVGGPVFFRGAIEGLRRGILHLDLPIALGLTLGLSGTLIGYLKHQEAHYADSLAAFIALMVVGRALERGMLVRNRNRILRSKGTEGLYARIRRDGVNQILKASEICKHDCLVVAPGEAAPVSGIAQMDALVSYDWIHGESRPVEIKKGELIQAGAINVGRKAFEYEALQTIEESRLSELLRQSSEGDIQSSQITSIRDFSAFWVIGILTIASIAFFWIFQNHGLEVALLRTTAILVVACPCAIGIAVPLSRELAAVELERRGVFIRRNRAFDRLNQIDTIALDKTGTLTTGKLKLSKKSEELIHRKLSRDELKALYTLVLASEHPKSAAIRKVIESSHSISAVDSTCVEEIVGDGLMALIDGKEWRLGRAKWAVLSEYWSDIPEEADVIFGCDGKLIAAFSTEEELRQDVQREITELRQRGYRVVVLSGDRRHRVQDLGMRLGFDSSDLYAELSPNQKADWLNGKRAFFVGDGVNDSLAADAAFVSASPAIERPFLPSKTDFVFWWDGIAPIRWTIDISHFLNRLTLSNIFYAVAYNAFGILAAAYGMFPPWLAAIAMPLSSILIVTRTFYRFRRHSESMNRVESRSRKGYAYAAENVRHSFVRG